jgi:hypothetical protein
MKTCDMTGGQSSPMRIRLRGLVLVALAAVGAIALVNAQNYTIDWSTIDGGGGTSTGGVYSVTGTIGQPDAGVMSGGNYTVQGGFWGLVAAVQTPGAPLLTIARATNTVTVSWPLSTTVWVLEQTSNPTNTAWIPIAPPYQTNSTQNLFVTPASAGNQYFRLHKQ